GPRQSRQFLLLHLLPGLGGLVRGTPGGRPGRVALRLRSPQEQRAPPGPEGGGPPDLDGFLRGAALLAADGPRHRRRGGHPCGHKAGDHLGGPNHPPGREAPLMDLERQPAPVAGPVAPPASVTASRARVLLGIFVLLAILSRFYHLGERPLHHDESIHAFQSYTLAKDGTWWYDPAYHGPFLYYANALIYKIVGLPHVTNATARFLPAVFGLILIAFACPLAR